MKIKFSKTLTKSIAMLSVACLFMAITTFAWFTIGNPSFVGLDNSVIKFPNGVSVGFYVGESENVEGGSIVFSNFVPLSELEFKVEVNKPANTKLKFSLKIIDLVPPLDENGSPLVDSEGRSLDYIFEMFILKHKINKDVNGEDIEYVKNLKDMSNPDGDNGYFLYNYDMDEAITKETIKFNLLFSDVAPLIPPLDKPIDVNNLQGLSLKLGKLELEIMY